MSGQGFSRKFAEFLTSTSYDKLSPALVVDAKHRILDLVGVCLAGYKLMSFPQTVVEYVGSIGGKPEATVIGLRRKVPAVNAALANGACAHALDMDDGNRLGGLHPGAAVIPGALAAAELAGATTRELITGVVVGYEVMIRTATAIYPSSLLRGFHPSGLVAPFGAVAAAANIMKLNFDETVAAIGLAGLQGAGINEVVHDDEAAKVKALHMAKGAQAGILSAVLARMGNRGPETILEGEDGFLRAVSDKVDTKCLTENLGKCYGISESYIKFYSSCAHTHPAIFVARTALRNGGIKPEDISKISIETYPIALRTCGTVVHPNTPSLGRFSIPFAVALSLIKNSAGAADFSPDAVEDKAIQGLAGKVELSLSNKWDKAYPQKRGAAVTITDKRGKVGKADMAYARAEGITPEDWQDLYDKFMSNASALVSPRRARLLKDTIMNLENVSLSDFVRLI